jgi:prepilin-type processing-associated H-X9-DG protein
MVMQARFPARKISCIENIRQAAQAQLIYATDHDARFPPAKKWVEATIAYASPSTSIYQCPAVRNSSFGFAMSQFWDGRSVDRNAKSVLLFEPRNAHINASGYPLKDSASPPRHGNKNNFAFVDGSAKSLTLAEMKALP